MKPRPMQAVTHHLIGSVPQVVNVLTTAQIHGRLLGHSTPHVVSRALVAIDVTLLEPVPRRVLRQQVYRTCWRYLRRSLMVLAWLAGLAAIGAVGWGVWLLLVWADAHRWQLLGFGIVAFLLIGAAGAVSTSDRGGRR